MGLATGAIRSIISKLAELLKEEYKLQTGVKRQVESLTNELESAHAFLQEIDKVPPDQLNQQVKIWACEVREASYDMEDILDAFLVRVKDSKPVKETKLERLKEKIHILFSRTMARHGIANAIQEVNKKLKEIDERHRRYELDQPVAAAATSSSKVDPRIALVHRTKASELIGIDGSKDAIIKMLSHDDMSEKKAINVVSIVGFGGVGKTTLAKATYDQLKQRYECGAFVSVGQNPDLVKVFKDILFELDKDKFADIHCTERGPDLIIRELLEFLEHKRYLIVVDDVWERRSVNRITEALAQNNIGSRIIITTRNLDIVIGEVYNMQPLSEDNSKKLFYARIFGGEDKCPDNQRNKVSAVAHKILRKCGGVPLAIITMASLLVPKSMEEWFEVCNSIGFRDKEKEQSELDTMWILSLSYYDLPSHLKTCLLYLRVFPEDHLIKKDALIWMWIAEGFVNGKPGTSSFEIGEGYFNDLINRNLIQPVETRKSRNIKGCRLHDMILDLIRSLSREANLSIIDNGQDKLLGSKERWLAFQNSVEEDTPQDNPRARSFIAFGCSFGLWSFQSFKLLRLLYLEGCFTHLNELYLLPVPEEIGALKFLRVLCLEDMPTRLLPSSVGMLTQLVCLRAWHHSLLGGKIKNLTSLQELHISTGWCYGDMSTAQIVKDLGNLRELRVLRINTDYLTDRRMQLDLLKSLDNLPKLQRLELDCLTRTGRQATEWLLQLPLLPGLCQLVLSHVPGLPPCIDPSLLPNLSRLSMYLPRHLDDHGLKILGELPELRYLKLEVLQPFKATVTGSDAHGYFQKLRTCLLSHSMIQFVVNEDSSVSFTMWQEGYEGLTLHSKKKGNYKVRAVMPNLEVLYFRVHGDELSVHGRCANLGWECLASLQKVGVDLDCEGESNFVVEKEEDALRHAVHVHPNQPTLEINRIGGMVLSTGQSGSLSSNDDLSQEEEDWEEVLSTGDEGASQSRRSDEDEDEEGTPREDSS